MAQMSNDGTIYINRGDILLYPMFINMGDDDYPVRYDMMDHMNSIIQFSIMQPNQSFECGIIRKIFTHQDCNEYGDVVIKLKSNETAQLVQGKYYYQAKLVLDDGSINTITNKEIFYVR